ncbi:NAD(P)-dependent oxidoreductase [Catenuloplanes atrovinosus]|uniref:NADH-flavin reductase n=1 Tax=Catenuloplanes atrovinosus TaxID=137266 RepID=A0AAE3YNU6_9ACTN|nr:SDR family oxidoreductase [Catenuloplanes atrovinosus]MDR7277234.1 putative NADH-flavin reductase [Catenuloplanes atrovinosus]
MRLVVAGATGATGRHVVTRALHAGHRVTALVRRDGGFPAHPDLSTTYVNVVDDDTRLAGVLAETRADAIISTLGNPLARAPKILGRAHRTLVSAATRAGTPRIATMIAYGSAATTAPAPPAIRLLAATLLRTDFRDLGQVDAALAASALNWTIIHFGALTDDPPTGRWTLSKQLTRPSRYRVARADVADALLHAVTTDEFPRCRTVLSGARP